MPAFKIKVKWGKEIFQDVEVDTDEEPMVFKAQLMALTGVQPERQKVMLKGAILNDDSWEKMKLRDGAMVLMMGTKDEDMPSQPQEKTKFIEDMDDAELSKAMDMPAGLQNLGNTCYMNATVQCLKSIPELRESLSRFSGSVSLGGGNDSEGLTAALRDLYTTMDKGTTVPPIIMLQVLHTAFPRFAERGEGGGYQQQDANECWMEILRMLQAKAPATPESVRSNAIEQFMGIECTAETKCVESESEEPTQTVEKFLQYSCYIDKDVKYLHTGLKNRLTETIEKHSPSLDRNAAYTKTMTISRLPGYITIQMVRFHFKQSRNEGEAGVNAKVLKDVKFPVLLDMYEMCGKELKEKITPRRTQFKEYEDWLVTQAGANIKGPQGGKNKTEALKAERELKADTEFEDWSFPEDVGSNNSGYYVLQAVLTHKGRSSNSGHYVGWVRQKGENWLKCDDDEMSPVHEEDVLKLSGGGDWHTAYLLVYGPRKLPKDRGQSEKNKEDSTPAAAEDMETS